MEKVMDEEERHRLNKIFEIERAMHSRKLNELITNQEAEKEQF